jgi:hypothetical protein
MSVMDFIRSSFVTGKDQLIHLSGSLINCTRLEALKHFFCNNSNNCLIILMNSMHL